MKDSIENAKYSVEDIGFWHYKEPATSTTSNAALLEWWHDLTKQWELATRDDPQAWPPGFMLNPSTGHDLWTSVRYQPTRLSDAGRFIEAIFNGAFFGGTGNHEIWETSADSEYAVIDTLQSIYYGNISGCAEFDDYLSCGVENVAKAMTKTFRDSAYIAYGLESANVTVERHKLSSATCASTGSGSPSRCPYGLWLPYSGLAPSSTPGG